VAARHTSLPSQVCRGALPFFEAYGKIYAKGATRIRSRRGRRLHVLAVCIGNAVISAIYRLLG
jgi:hypothetical protein